MATSAVITEPTSVDTSATFPIKYETIEYAATVTLDDKGKIDKKALTTSEKKITLLESPEYATKVAADAKLEQLVFKQSVKRPLAGTIEGFQQLYPNVADQLFIINRGITVFADAQVRKVLLETNDDDSQFIFQPTDIPFDLTDTIKDVPKIVKMTAQEKAIETLKSSLPADMLAQIIAQLQAAQGK